jgi:hypothetical protein|tara:strand:- start:2395 stop:2859 length:465 start_codon:yes stop_codon:yes gene_type:complete
MADRDANGRLLKGTVAPNPDRVKNFAKSNRLKPWKAAIDRALSKKGKVDQAQELYLIAREVVESAQDRNNPNFQFAVKEVGLRLDGKPVETVELGDTAQKALGISQAFSLLAEFAGREEVVVGEVIVPDRPLLSTEVCPEEGGCSEGVDISKVP